MLECLLEKGVRTVYQKNSSDPFFSEVFFTRYRGSSRAVPPKELQRLGEELTGKRWPVYDELSAAWAAASRAAAPDEMICITGSFFLAAEMRG